MKKIHLTSLILILALFSCKKNPIQPEPDPEPIGSLTRSLVFPNQGGLVKHAHYNEVSKPETIATKADGRLSIGIIITPKEINSAGEAIVLAIDESHLQNGLIKDYDYVNTSSRIVLTRYTYSYMENSGDIWGSFTDSQTGVQFEGVLHITGYDKYRKLIKGSYSIIAKGLINDPTKKGIAGPIDPLNQCDLTVSGTFTNVKIRE